MGKRVIIIGAGFGGLASAALLAKQGFDVTVVEKNEQPGGRASVWEQEGFRFDMGPSWYMQPDVFERFFAEFGKKPEDYYELIRLDPSYRIYFGSEDVVDVPAGIKAGKKLFASLEKGGAKKFEEYLKQAKYQYDVGMEDFLYKEHRSLFDLFSWRMLTEGSKMHVFEDIESYVNKRFESERAKKILLYTLVFLGGAPRVTPALYSLMAYVDFGLGVWYAKGGFAAIVQGFVKLCEEQGVNFRYDEPVQEILTENGKAVGVRTSKGVIKADKVVVNADYHHAETSLLKPEDRSYSERYWDKRVVAPSAFIMYLGLDKQLPQLKHHTLFLDNDWQQHFESIFSDPGWPDKPSYYICCPSKTDPSVAPPGKENVFVLVPVAAGLDDTPEIRKAFEERVLDHLEQLLDEPIREHILIKRIFAHRDFSQQYNAYKGTALGLAHTLRQTASLRPRQRSKRVEDLYYVGQFTHPGIGVPMTIIGAQVIADMLGGSQ